MSPKCCKEDCTQAPVVKLADKSYCREHAREENVWQQKPLRVLRGVGGKRLSGKVKIRGEARTGRVWIGEREVFPYKAWKMNYGSPDGFMWGYMGSGPSCLSRAIMLEVVSSEEAQILDWAFKRDFVSRWRSECDFAEEVDFDEWLSKAREEWKDALSKDEGLRKQ